MILDKIMARRATSPPEIDGGGYAYAGRPVVAGVPVNETTAYNYAAFFACIRIISESMAALPLRVMQRDGDKRITVSDHAVARIMKARANEEMTAFEFRELQTSRELASGNAYAEIERDRAGRVVNLWPLPPSAVVPVRDSRGRIIYEIQQGQAKKQELTRRDIFHQRGLTVDGVVGRSVIAHARESIGLGLAAESFGSAFFGNGAHLGGIITNTGKSLKEEGIRNLLDTFNARHRGAKKAKKVEYLDAGLEFKEIGVPPEDAQFLETRRFQVIEVCRWFRMPPHKLGEMDRATHSNIESENISFVTDTLLPPATRTESQINAWLLSPEEVERGMFVRFNFESLLRGDSAARAKFYQIMRDLGAYDIDEIRAAEDLDPLPNGQGRVRVVPLNMQRIDQGGGRDQITESARAVVLRAVTSLVHVECQKIDKISRRPPEKWQAETLSFYRELRERITDLLAAPVGVCCDQMGVSGDPSQLAGAFAMQWVSQAAGQFGDALDANTVPELAESWKSNKPRLKTNELINSIHAARLDA